MATIQEKRRVPRFTVPMTLTAIVSKGEAHYSLETENVSETGLCLGARRLFPVGTHLHLVFGRPPHLSRVSAEGVVRWAEAGKGVGVEFTSISQEDRQALMKFLNSQSRSVGA
jgi:hypothetical protein